MMKIKSLWGRLLFICILVGLVTGVLYLGSCVGPRKINEEVKSKPIRELILRSKLKNVSISDPQVLSQISETLVSGGTGSQEAWDASPGNRWAYIDYTLLYGESNSYKYQAVVYESESGSLYLELYFAVDMGFQGDRNIFIDLATISPDDADQIKDILGKEGFKKHAGEEK